MLVGENRKTQDIVAMFKNGTKAKEYTHGRYHPKYSPKYSMKEHLPTWRVKDLEGGN
jgi:hypothetical protein